MGLTSLIKPYGYEFTCNIIFYNGVHHVCSG